MTAIRSRRLSTLLMLATMRVSSAFCVMRAAGPRFMTASPSDGKPQPNPDRPIQLLDSIIQLRGNVERGFGRGSKKLGFPTANLPTSLFQEALQDLPTGVYVGHAAIEPQSRQPYKAVVNIGYSPTFVDQENPEKIVEAHLLDYDGGGDFYDNAMRLQLGGYLRAEKKFDSFPELVQQIGQDAVDAEYFLTETLPYRDMGCDVFVSSTDSWVGSSGGGETASWEIAAMSDFLKKNGIDVSST